MERRLQQIFFALSFLSLALIIVAGWQADSPKWKDIQRKYNQLEAAGEPNAASKAAIIAAKPEVHQFMLTGLQRVDRCTTCHLGVEDPTMKDAAEPYKYHANLGPHVPSKFGCTICHGGQGLATNKEDAHGNVEFWENPLLPKEYIRASCGRCHKDGEVPGVPELTEGKHLFDTQGCRGCHKLNGIGGSIGPDLTEEGAHHRSPQWLEEHFLTPGAVSAGSAMPNFHFTREQAKALTYYMLSLTNEDMGSYFSSERSIPGPDYGRQIFKEKNCISCHMVGGVGGKIGPDLLGVVKRHSTQWLDEQLVNPELVYPGSAMPAYDLDINSRKAIVAYMSVATAEDVKSWMENKAHAQTPEEVAIAAGRQDFVRYGCVGCHGTELQGGVPNPNAQGGEVPSLLHLADDYTKDEVIAVIRNGRMPPLDDPKGKTPPLYMPSWKNVMSDEDVHRIADYLWSKQQQKKDSW